MATRCIDVSENKRLTSVSPISIFAFLAIYVVITALVEFGIIYFILILLDYIFTQLFFQFTPRFIFLSLKFMSTNTVLTPNCEDMQYIPDETRLKGLKGILPEMEKEDLYASWD